VGRKWESETGDANSNNPQDAVLPYVEEKMQEQQKEEKRLQIEAGREGDEDELIKRHKVAFKEKEARNENSRRKEKEGRKGRATEEMFKVGEEEKKPKDGRKDEASIEGMNREDEAKVNGRRVGRCRKVNRKRKWQSKGTLMERLIMKEKEKGDMERREELAGMKEEARLKRRELATRIGEQLEVEEEAKEFWRQVPLEEMRRVKERIKVQEKEERVKVREKEQKEKMEREVRRGGTGTRDEEKAKLVTKVLWVEGEAIIQAYHGGGSEVGADPRLP